VLGDRGLAAAACGSLEWLPEHVVFLKGWLLLEVDWLEAFFLSWSGVEVLGGSPEERVLDIC